MTDVQNTIDLANSWGAANVFTEGACDPTDPACTGVDREVTIAASAAGISWTHYQCEQRLRSLEAIALPCRPCLALTNWTDRGQARSRLPSSLRRQRLLQRTLQRG